MAAPSCSAALQTGWSDALSRFKGSMRPECGFASTCVPICAPRKPSSRSEERRVGKSVDLGGRRSIKKKKKNRKKCQGSNEREYDVYVRAERESECDSGK